MTYYSKFTVFGLLLAVVGLGAVFQCGGEFQELPPEKVLFAEAPALYVNGDFGVGYAKKRAVTAAKGPSGAQAFNYQLFIINNSPASAGAGKAAEYLFSSGLLIEAERYSKDVLRENIDINEVVGSVPVLLSAYKVSGHQFNFTRDLSDVVLYLHQMDEEGNKSKIDNIIFNALSIITTTNGFTPREQKYLLEQISSSLGHIPYLREQIADFSSRLDQSVATDSFYNSDGNFHFTGGILVAPPL